MANPNPRHRHVWGLAEDGERVCEECGARLLLNPATLFPADPEAARKEVYRFYYQHISVSDHSRMGFPEPVHRYRGGGMRCHTPIPAWQEEVQVRNAQYTKLFEQAADERRASRAAAEAAHASCNGDLTMLHKHQVDQLDTRHRRVYDELDPDTPRSVVRICNDLRDRGVSLSRDHCKSCMHGLIHRGLARVHQSRGRHPTYVSIVPKDAKNEEELDRIEKEEDSQPAPDIVTKPNGPAPAADEPSFESVYEALTTLSKELAAHERDLRRAAEFVSAQRRGLDELLEKQFLRAVSKSEATTEAIDMAREVAKRLGGLFSGDAEG